jgi:hypothetical protein
MLIVRSSIRTNREFTFLLQKIAENALGAPVSFMKFTHSV